MRNVTHHPRRHHVAVRRRGSAGLGVAMSGNGWLARDLATLPRGSLAVRVAEALAERRQVRDQGEPDERSEPESSERRPLSQITRSGRAIIRPAREEDAAVSAAAGVAEMRIEASPGEDDAAVATSPGADEEPAAGADNEQAAGWVDIAQRQAAWVGKETSTALDGPVPAGQAAAEPTEPASDGASRPAAPEAAAALDALEQAHAETAHWRARAEQAQAELATVRRRAERNLIELSEVAVGEVMTGIIPIMDDLERAVAHLPAVLQGDPWVAGVLMIGDRLRTALETHGVERIVPQGETFDPHRHEAIAQFHRDDIPEDTITNVLLAGYILNGRVLRPAHVQVAVRKDH